MPVDRPAELHHSFIDGTAEAICKATGVEPIVRSDQAGKPQPSLSVCSFTTPPETSRVVS